MERISSPVFGSGYRMSNGTVELTVSTEFGPRVLQYGLVGDENVLGEFPDLTITTEYGDWKPYAGHRFWVAPEAMPFSYAPDNEPVEIRIEGKLSIRLIQATDAAGLAKELTVTLSPSGTEATISHRLTNRRTTPIEVSVWAITVFREGTAFLPLAPYASHADALLPNQPLALWPFTDLTDARWSFAERTVSLRSDPSLDHPQKIGAGNESGIAAYHRGSTLFVKQSAYLSGANYPDMGSSTELYTEGAFLEVESLSPLARLEPGGSISHIERWSLATDVQLESVRARLHDLTR